MIRIDGSYLEGGGQILRTALSLSVLTGKPFEISRIRKNRPKQGLRPQHLACVKAAAEMCSGKFESAKLSSTELKFYPGKIGKKTLSVDIGTAGSTSLLLQSLIVPSVFGVKKAKIKVVGGTDVPFSPTSTYFSEVFLPQLRKYSSEISYKVSKHGFMHEGGGKAELSVKSKFSLDDCPNFEEFLSELRKSVTARVDLKGHSNLLQVKGRSIASSDLQKASVAERQASAARLALAGLNIPIRIDAAYAESLSTGSVITLWAVFGGSEVSQTNPLIMGCSELGGRGRSSEDVGKSVAIQLLEQISSGSPIDKHLADQLIPFMALASGVIETPEMTPHCLANVHTTEKFLGRSFEIDGGKKTIAVPLQKYRGSSFTIKG